MRIFMNHLLLLNNFVIQQNLLLILMTVQFTVVCHFNMRIDSSLIVSTLKLSCSHLLRITAGELSFWSVVIWILENLIWMCWHYKQLQLWKLWENSYCSNYNEKTEDLMHFLIECDFVKLLWQKLSEDITSEFQIKVGQSPIAITCWLKSPVMQQIAFMP